MAATTQLVDFTPDGIDMIFAISQQNLNEGLAEYITGLAAEVSWGFDVDENGNLTLPADPAQPDISFSGVLSPPVPTPSGEPAWIVDLSQESVNQNQVTFNVTFADGATFIDNQYAHRYVQSAASGETGLWAISFQVALTLTALSDLTNLPDNIKSQVAALHGEYGQVFTLSQVLLDLQTLSAVVDPEARIPAGISRYEWDTLNQGMYQYLQANYGIIYTSPPSAGYAMVHNGTAPKTQLPAFSPTAVDFVISPNPTNPGASTFIFVFMMGGTDLPSDPAEAFENVTLISDPANTPGVALIAASHLVSFLQKHFTAIGIDTLINRYVECSSGGEFSGTLTWDMATSSSAAAATTATPTSTETDFVQWSMPSQSSSADTTDDTYYSTSSTTTSNAAASLSNFQAGLGYTTVQVSGTLGMTVNYSEKPDKGVTVGWTSPKFSWTWSVPYSFQPVDAANAQSGGGIQFVRQDSLASYPNQPTSDDDGTNWASAASSQQDILTTIFDPVITSLQKNFQTGVSNLSSVNNFIFPIGGGTFTFQSPAANSVFALYSTIQYQNPN